MNIRRVKDVAILAPRGWLMGGDETDEFEQTIRQLIQEGNRRLIIDLGDVAMMSSTALGVCAGCRASYANRQGRVVLCNVDKKIWNIFVITKLALLFDTYQSEREALAALDQSTLV